MKLNVITKSSGAGREPEEARIIRMRQFWARPEMAKLVFLGRLLANRGEDGKVLAETLATKGELTLTDMDLGGGVTLPIAQTLTLKSGASWLCPVCGSAHGTRIGVSGKGTVSVPQLASNTFYYSPVERKVFTVSDTCATKYTSKVAAGWNSRLIEPKQAMALLSPAPATGKAR